MAVKLYLSFEFGLGLKFSFGSSIKKILETLIMLGMVLVFGIGLLNLKARLRCLWFM